MEDKGIDYPTCPKCGCGSVARIAWSMPAYSEELMEDLDAGRVHIGGCCVTGEDPEWHCNDCEHEWGYWDKLSQ